MWVVVCSSKGKLYKAIVLSVVVAEWGTPGPIPNPEAKPSSADGTALARVWESRSPPTSKVKHRKAPTARWGPFFLSTGARRMLVS